MRRNTYSDTKKCQGDDYKTENNRKISQKNNMTGQRNVEAWNIREEKFT